MTTRIVFLLIIFSFFNASNSNGQHFVNQAVIAGNNDGSSWANAFSDLQAAISTAQYGDTIWVAEGTYFSTATTDRSISFQLKNGVKMFGGFKGNENSLLDRDWQNHKTILSGDIGVPGNLFDNSFHVLFGRGVDSTTILDGFNITAAYGPNAPFEGSQMDPRGGGLLLLGAWDLSETNPVIRNCRFERNYSSQGGGIYCARKDEDFPDFVAGLVNPRLKNCQFVGNYGSAGGGGMMKRGPTSPGDTLLIDHCTFFDNKSPIAEGAGMYIDQAESSVIRLLGCVFEKDSALSGGGLTFYSKYEGGDKNTLLLDSCIFKGNVGSEGGGLYLEGVYGLGHTEFVVKMENCRFEANRAKWANGAAYLIQAFDHSKVSVTIDNCLFLNNITWTSFMTNLAVWEESEVTLDVSNSAFIGNDPNTPFTAALHCGVGGSSGSTNNFGKVNISNCLFAHNGAGVAMLGSEYGQMETHIRNCTFFNNNKYIFTKSHYSSFNVPNNPYYNRMYIDNCIAWEPRSTFKTFCYNNVVNLVNFYQFSINNSMLTLNPNDTIIPAGSPLAFGDYVYLNLYPEFIDTLSGDYRLKSCSPLRNLGNNAIAINGNYTTDINGLPRIQFGTVDLGAFEIQDSCLESAVLEPEALPLRIWPNPSYDGYLTFNFPELLNEYAILTVYTLLGQEVDRQLVGGKGLVIVNLGHLKNNKYVIQLKTDKAIYTACWLKL